MNETQFYISVAVMPVTTIIIVLIGVLVNNNNMNHRLSEMSAQFNARLDDTKDVLRAEIARVHTEVSKVESVLLSKFAEMDTRIDGMDARLRRIEDHLNLN